MIQFEKNLICFAGFEDGRRDHELKNRVDFKVGRGKEVDFPLEPPESNVALSTPQF